jgi:hypothetical protein
MAVAVGIFSESGKGKTTSIIVNPDGSIAIDGLLDGSGKGYLGMDPKSTVIINADKKQLPFPNLEQNGWVLGKNVFWESDASKIKALLIKANGYEHIKSIYIDTINSIMLDKEMNDIKKKSYDKWADLAQDIYELITFCNSELRKDIIVYLGGHVTIYTDVDGNESKCLVTNGKKLEKIRLETKLTTVLYSSVLKGTDGNNQYRFETQENRSTAKSPLGMFKDFLIPNSLRLVDDTVRKYYKI